MPVNPLGGIGLYPPASSFSPGGSIDLSAFDIESAAAAAPFVAVTAGLRVVQRSITLAEWLTLNSSPIVLVAGIGGAVIRPLFGFSQGTTSGAAAAGALQSGRLSYANAIATGLTSGFGFLQTNLSRKNVEIFQDGGGTIQLTNVDPIGQNLMLSTVANPTGAAGATNIGITCFYLVLSPLFP